MTTLLVILVRCTCQKWQLWSHGNYNLFLSTNRATTIYFCFQTQQKDFNPPVVIIVDIYFICCSLSASTCQSARGTRRWCTRWSWTSASGCGRSSRCRASMTRWSGRRQFCWPRGTALVPSSSLSSGPPACWRGGCSSSSWSSSRSTSPYCVSRLARSVSKGRQGRQEQWLQDLRILGSVLKRQRQSFKSIFNSLCNTEGLCPVLAQ